MNSGKTPDNPQEYSPKLDSTDSEGEALGNLIGTGGPLNLEAVRHLYENTGRNMRNILANRRSLPSKRSSEAYFRELENLLLEKENEILLAADIGQVLLKEIHNLQAKVTSLENKPYQEAEEIVEEIRKSDRETLKKLKNFRIEAEAISSSLKEKPGKFLAPGSPYTPRRNANSFLDPPEIDDTKPAYDSSHSELNKTVEAGDNLLEAARTLQKNLAESEKKLHLYMEMATEHERQVTTLGMQINRNVEHEAKLQEATWNMELEIQELKTKLDESETNFTKALNDQKKLQDKLTIAKETIDSHKDREEAHLDNLERTKARHEQEMTGMRRVISNLQREKAELHKKVDDLKTELNGKIQRMGGRLTGQTTPLRDSAVLNANTHSELSDNDNFFTSPTQSPFNIPAQGQSLQMETLNGSLSHAHRTIATLRSSLHREKIEKLELKKMLAESQEKVETMEKEVLWESDNAEAVMRKVNNSVSRKMKMKRRKTTLRESLNRSKSDLNGSRVAAEDSDSGDKSDQTDSLDDQAYSNADESIDDEDEDDEETKDITRDPEESLEDSLMNDTFDGNNTPDNSGGIKRRRSRHTRQKHANRGTVRNPLVAQSTQESPVSTLALFNELSKVDQSFGGIEEGPHEVDKDTPAPVKKTVDMGVQVSLLDIHTSRHNKFGASPKGLGFPSRFDFSFSPSDLDNMPFKNIPALFDHSTSVSPDRPSSEPDFQQHTFSTPTDSRSIVDSSHSDEAESAKRTLEFETPSKRGSFGGKSDAHRNMNNGKSIGTSKIPSSPLASPLPVSSSTPTNSKLQEELVAQPIMASAASETARIEGTTDQLDTFGHPKLSGVSAVEKEPSDSNENDTAEAQTVAQDDPHSSIRANRSSTTGSNAATQDTISTSDFTNPSATPDGVDVQTEISQERAAERTTRLAGTPDSENADKPTEMQSNDLSRVVSNGTAPTVVETSQQPTASLDQDSVQTTKGPHVVDQLGTQQQPDGKQESTPATSFSSVDNAATPNQPEEIYGQGSGVISQSTAISGQELEDTIATVAANSAVQPVHSGLPNTHQTASDNTPKEIVKDQPSSRRTADTISNPQDIKEDRNVNESNPTHESATGTIQKPDTLETPQLPKTVTHVGTYVNVPAETFQLSVEHDSATLERTTISRVESTDEEILGSRDQLVPRAIDSRSMRRSVQINQLGKDLVVQGVNYPTDVLSNEMVSSQIGDQATCADGLPNDVTRDVQSTTEVNTREIGTQTLDSYTQPTTAAEPMSPAMKPPPLPGTSRAQRQKEIMQQNRVDVRRSSVSDSSTDDERASFTEPTSTSRPSTSQSSITNRSNSLHKIPSRNMSVRNSSAMQHHLRESRLSVSAPHSPLLNDGQQNSTHEESGTDAMSFRRRTIGVDPAIIHAITQTMMGNYMWKYTRKVIGGGISEKKHLRFFWVHPYAKTINWCAEQSGTDLYRSKNSKTKVQYVTSVRVVLDQQPTTGNVDTNPYSLIIQTPNREMKIKALEKERHDLWLLALTYLQTRQPIAPVSASTYRSRRWSAGSNNNSTLESDEEHTQHTITSSRSNSSFALPPSQMNANLSRTLSTKQSLSRLFKRPSKVALNTGTGSTHEPEELDDVKKCCQGKHDINQLSQ